MKIMKSVLQFLKNEDGPTAVEYAVMLALIVAVCVTAVTRWVATPIVRARRDRECLRQRGKLEFTLGSGVTMPADWAANGGQPPAGGGTWYEWSGGSIGSGSPIPNSAPSGGTITHTGPDTPGGNAYYVNVESGGNSLSVVLQQLMQTASSSTPDVKELLETVKKLPPRNSMLLSKALLCLSLPRATPSQKETKLIKHINRGLSAAGTMLYSKAPLCSPPDFLVRHINHTRFAGALDGQPLQPCNRIANLT